MSDVISITNYPSIPHITEAAKKFGDDIQEVLVSFSEVCKTHGIKDGIMITIKQGQIFMYGSSETFPQTEEVK